MLWVYTRLVKYFHWIFKHENVSADWLAGQIKSRRMGKKFGIKKERYFFAHDEQQFSIGENSHINKESSIWCHDNDDTGPVEGGKSGRGYLRIGSNVYIGLRFCAACYDEVTIGDDCLLADDILIMTANHGMNPEIPGSYVKQPFTVGGVHIEEGCWIGSRVTVLPDVTIGKRCIIGTNSVVTKDIPPYSIAVGIPARVVKRWDFDSHRWERYLR